MPFDLIKQANKFKRESKLNEAIATYWQAMKINPSFAWYYHELGDALAKKKGFWMSQFVNMVMLLRAIISELSAELILSLA